MSATLTVRHTVADYATWRVVYDNAETIRAKHGCTGDQVFRLPANANDVFATHDFPTVSQAEAFAGDPALAAALQRGGVTSAPRIGDLRRCLTYDAHAGQGRHRRPPRLRWAS